jgi:hypothetical protein
MAQIKKIGELMWTPDLFKDQKECSICYDAFETSKKCKVLPDCMHLYHSLCIDKWFKDERRCPICNVEVKVPK